MMYKKKASGSKTATKKCSKCGKSITKGHKCGK